MGSAIFAVLLAVALVSSAFAATGYGSSYPVSCALSPSPVSAKAGATASLSVSCSDMNGNSVACPVMQWSSTIGSMSSGPTANGATFSAGTSAGSGTITAMAPPLSQPTVSCNAQATVTPGDPASVTILPAQATISVGGTQQFAAQLYDQYGNPITSATTADQFTWTATGGIGSVGPNGLFTAKTAGSGQVTVAYYNTPSLQGIRASADVSVSSSVSQKYCAISPSQASVQVAQQQAFSITCYSSDPRMMGPQNTEIPCPAVTWAASDGKIQPSPSPAVSQTATFTAPTTAEAVAITAYENTPLANPVGGMQCAATANVTAGPAATVAISPTSASLFVGDTQQFSAAVDDQYGNPVYNEQLSWGATGGIGSVDSNGLFTAASEGSGTVRVDVACPLASPNGCPHDTAAVSVSAAPSGTGNGGTGGGSGGSGGGSFASSSTVSYTCAGKPGTLSVQVFRPGATALAELYYMAAQPPAKVLSVNAASNQQVAFTPANTGSYELRVTVGNEQRDADFSVPACTPSSQNATKTVNIQLQQNRNTRTPPVQQAPNPGPGPQPVVQPQGSGIPVYVLAGGAVLILAWAYFLLFGKKK